TGSPATSELRMAFTTAFTACPATAWFSSVARATFSISSDWFISDLQLQRYETPTLARAGLKSESGPDTFGDFQFDELVAPFFPFAMRLTLGLSPELLFQLLQGNLCPFGIDPPALDRSLAPFERGRKLFIGQIGTRIIVSRRCNEIPQFDGNGI